MIVCTRCNKENLDHYKFCLGCGAELMPNPTDATIQADEAISPQGTPMPQICTHCGSTVPENFSFCGNCGTPLKQAQRTLYQGAVAPPPQTESTPFVKLVLIRPDGSEGDQVLIRDAKSVIGRNSGPPFDADGYLSPQHVHLQAHGDTIMIEDAGSLNGVFIRTMGDEPLNHGDVFRIGQELLRFDAIGDVVTDAEGTEILGSPNPGYWGRLSLVAANDEVSCAFPLMGDEMILGREVGDILFSDDGYVSGTHAKVWLNNGTVVLSDLGSSNGTFVRVCGARTLPYGSFILMGQQLFRVDHP